MKVYSTNAAHRVSTVAHDLPGEFQWNQWFRGAVIWAASTVVSGYVLTRVGATLGIGGWWPVMSVILAVTGSLILVAAVTVILGRYETPYTPLAYLWRSLRAELRAPRPPDRHAVGPTTHLLNTAPLDVREVVTESRIRSTCDYPHCDQGGPVEPRQRP